MSNRTPLTVSTIAPPGEPRRIVFLHPGIFATPAFFQPLVPFLLERGCVVVAFDPRGMGVNADEVQGRVDTRLRVEDLLEVVGRVLPTLPPVPVGFLGHSFGGLVIYAALVRAFGPTTRADWAPRVDHLVTIASPYRRASDRGAPWNRLFSEHTKRLVEEYASDGWIELEQFMLAQKDISTRLRDRLPIPLAVVRATLARARESALSARLLLSSPFPSTFLYAPGDFTPESFRDFLASGAMDHDSAAIVLELIDSGISGRLELDGVDANEAVGDLPLERTTVASPLDQLVTPSEAALPRAANLVLEGEARCGHAGYLYRPASLESVQRHVGERFP